jgi:alkylation response protein AidB-like acyl-CoA dehydrogenase/ubiquinone/menaquinone biosynthesis C-methylase UbiE
MPQEGIMITQDLEQAREGWDSIAAGYDRFVTRTEVWLANEALKRAKLVPGEAFLDVAAGCGGLSLPAARLGARVMASDWSPTMIQHLVARAREEGLSSLEAHVMDCHALDFSDDTFDLCGSQFGVMLVPEQPLALNEMVRVTKAGGRVLLIAYGSPAEIEFLHFWVAAVKAVDPDFHGVPMDPPPLEFQVADPNVLRGRLTDAGLKDVTVETVIEKLEFRSGQEMWDCVLNGNPLAGMLVAHLTEEQKSDVRLVMDGMLRERSGGSGAAVLTNPVHIGIGTKRMTKILTSASTVTPRVDPVNAVATLTDLIRSECHDMDSTRRVPTAVVSALQKAEIFRLMAPEEIGGHEIHPVTFLDVVEAASYADGSVGWCVLIGGCYATFGGMLPQQGARDIYGNPETISAGAFRPDGKAVEVEGGFRVTGRWPFASGSTHANWYIGGCTIMRNGAPAVAPSGAPLMREVFFPSSVVEIIDTWDSTGLRGTASHDYAVSDVFVPASHTVWFQDRPSSDRPLYRMPPIAMFSTFIGAVPLGIARHAIDEFMKLADAKTPALSTSVLADKAMAQDRLGRAYALVAAGRRYLTETLNDVWEKVKRDNAPSMADRGALWLAATHAGRSGLEAIEILYSAAGASSVYHGCSLDRCLRDARTAVQHVCTQETNFELAGRLLLGRSSGPTLWGMDYRGEA